MDVSDDFESGGLAGGSEAVTLRLGLPKDFASAAPTAALVAFSAACRCRARAGSNGRGTATIIGDETIAM
jgi:hypothetical protein